MGHMKQFCSNEFRCIYEMPVISLSGEWQEATTPAVTEAKITSRNTQGQLSASSSWSHTQPEPPFPWERHLDTPGSWGTEPPESPGTRTWSLHPQTASHLSTALTLTFYSTCSKTKLASLASSPSTESSKEKMLVGEIPFFFWVKCWKEKSQIYSKVAQTSREERTD